jgi:hypothetical protein
VETPKRTFGALVPTTKTRSDLGLRLPADQRASGRLEPAKNFAQSSVTHKIGLASVADVDDFVVSWLKRAYELNV